MKIDRLLGILNHLLEKKSVTAPELAKYFEVSRRTIIRDIDDLDRAGFPIVTKQGSGGGISLMEGFRFDSKLVKREEMIHIITGLKGLDSVSNSQKIDGLLKRLAIPATESISIDLASHYKSSISSKIELLDKAIEECRMVRFQYFSKKGENLRIVEPGRIVFRWSDWYVMAFCRISEGFRMFKLNRLWELELLNETYVPRFYPEEKSDFNNLFDDSVQFEVLFDNSVKYRLVEDYGPESFSQRNDGDLYFSRGYSDRDFIVSWIFSFGDKAKVLSPDALVSRIKKTSKKMNDIYN